MANPFTGIITAALKTTFNNAIDAILESGACSVPCILSFGGQKFIDCVNCIGGTLYQGGGPIPFAQGKICPFCHGLTKFPVEESETVYLLPIFDKRKWKTFATEISIKAPNMLAETMCLMELYPKIKACQHIILDSTNKDYSRNTYKRLGEPEPLGFGDMRYILTAWERVV